MPDFTEAQAIQNVLSLNEVDESIYSMNEGKRNKYKFLIRGHQEDFNYTELTATYAGDNTYIVTLGTDRGTFPDDEVVEYYIYRVSPNKTELIYSEFSDSAKAIRMIFE